MAKIMAALNIGRGSQCVVRAELERCVMHGGAYDTATLSRTVKCKLDERHINDSVGMHSAVGSLHNQQGVRRAAGVVTAVRNKAGLDDVSKSTVQRFAKKTCNVRKMQKG